MGGSHIFVLNILSQQLDFFIFSHHLIFHINSNAEEMEVLQMTSGILRGSSLWNRKNTNVLLYQTLLYLAGSRQKEVIRRGACICWDGQKWDEEKG